MYTVTIFQRDRARDAWLARAGIETMRFPPAMFSTIWRPCSGGWQPGQSPACPSTTRLRRAVPLPETSSGRNELAEPAGCSGRGTARSGVERNGAQVTSFSRSKGEMAQEFERVMKLLARYGSTRNEPH
jgi:hypothetical protein